MRKYLSSQIGKTLELSQVLINRLSETKVFMSTFVWMTVDNIRFTMSNTDKKTNGKLSKPVVWWELREFSFGRAHHFQLHLSFNYFGFAFVSPEERKLFFLLWKNLPDFECRIFFLFFLFFFLVKRNFKSSTYFFLSVLFRRRAWIRFHSVEIWKFCKSLKIVHDHNHSVFTTEFLKHFNCTLWLSNNN
jgi:hypothetical protein